MWELLSSKLGRTQLRLKILTAVELQFRAKLLETTRLGVEQREFAISMVNDILIAIILQRGCMPIRLVQNCKFIGQYLGRMFLFVLAESFQQKTAIITARR